jgi:shikimate dehydrogenase
MRVFAIFGNPVHHSKSPLMHNHVFKKLSIDGCYTRVLLEDGSKLKDTFLSLKLSGANVTVPHKEAAFQACDEIRGFALKVGVVNTIVNENGKLIGYNTDADGFMFAIKEFKNIKKVLILGAGGTAKALSHRFKDENFDVSILNRSQNRLLEFKESGFKIFSFNEIKTERYDLIVNTTSAGLEDDQLPAPKEILEPLSKRVIIYCRCYLWENDTFLEIGSRVAKRVQRWCRYVARTRRLSKQLFYRRKILS